MHCVLYLTYSNLVMSFANDSFFILLSIALLYLNERVHGSEDLNSISNRPCFIDENQERK